MTHCESLTVKAIDKEDVYRDRIRIPVAHRGTIPEGSVCKLSVDDRSVLVEVRGVRTADGEPDPGAVIFMDEVTRGKLLVFPHGTHQFTMKEVWWPKQFWWAWNAADPTPRIAAKLGVIGLALGALGAILGVIALYP